MSHLRTRPYPKQSLRSKIASFDTQPSGITVFGFQVFKCGVSSTPAFPLGDDTKKYITAIAEMQTGKPPMLRRVRAKTASPFLLFYPARKLKSAAGGRKKRHSRRFFAEDERWETKDEMGNSPIRAAACNDRIRCLTTHGGCAAVCKRPQAEESTPYGNYGVLRMFTEIIFS